MASKKKTYPGLNDVTIVNVRTGKNIIQPDNTPTLSRYRVTKNTSSIYVQSILIDATDKRDAITQAKKINDDDTQWSDGEGESDTDYFVEAV